MYQGSFFEIADSYERLDRRGDPLAKIEEFVDWSTLLPILEPISFKPSDKGGRPSWSPLVMVKCLLLQSLYNIADESCEYQINDRLSFKRFLKLRINQKAPDEKTIWLYRERIKEQGLHEAIFKWFDDQLNKAGYLAQKGQILDATFVPTHKPTGKQEKQEEALTAAQACQMDLDATFTKKHNKTYHGYKNHIQIDSKHKIIRRQIITTASRHDGQESQALTDVKGNTGRPVYADGAYPSEEFKTFISDNKLIDKVHYRAYRNKPLSVSQKRTNTTRSRVRARVEHVFGHMVTAMGGLMIHTIGLARAEVKVTFKNLAYNIHRFTFFEHQKTVKKAI